MAMDGAFPGRDPLSARVTASDPTPRRVAVRAWKSASPRPSGDEGLSANWRQVPGVQASHQNGSGRGSLRGPDLIPGGGFFASVRDLGPGSRPRCADLLRCRMHRCAESDHDGDGLVFYLNVDGFWG